MKSYVPCAILLGVALMMSGCPQKTKTAESVAPAEERYPLTGEVISVDAARKVLVVMHDEVKGHMPAMTMEFSVSAADVAAAKKGERIRAEMIPSKTGNYRLEKIWPDERMAVSQVESQAAALRQDTLIRGKSAYREVGENVPDFALYDQEGNVVRSARFHGRKVMLNFIFTRCPVANMCPAATMRMMSTQELAKKAGVNDIEFVSITLDPAYDSPAVLKAYAAERGIDTSNFSFLTGPDAAIKDLLAQFGVLAEFKDNLLVHTLTTLLINENGKIIYRADGSAWEPKDFVERMKK